MAATSKINEAVKAVKLALNKLNQSTTTTKVDVDAAVKSVMMSTGNFSPPRYGTHNSFWAPLKPPRRWGLRWSVAKEATHDLLTSFNNENELATILGRAKIGPAVLEHGHVQVDKFIIYYMVIEIFQYDLKQFLKTSHTPDDLKVIAEELKKLICRTAMLGFVNLDIKPGNIVLSRVETTLEVRLIDFGLDFFRTLFAVPELATECGGKNLQMLAAVRATSAFVQFRLLCLHLSTATIAGVNNNITKSRELSRSLATTFGSRDGSCDKVTLNVPRSAAEAFLSAMKTVWRHYLKTTHPLDLENVFPDLNKTSCSLGEAMKAGNVDFTSPNLKLLGSDEMTYDEVAAWINSG